MKNKKLAITIGCFDMLHEGHINLLKKMKEEADLVFVYLHNNTSIYENKGRFPVQNWDDRAENLLSCGIVNKVFCVRNANPGEEVRNSLNMVVKRRIKVDPENIVYFRGDDWVDFPGKDVIKEQGIEIKIVPYSDGVSSTKRRDALNKK